MIVQTSTIFLLGGSILLLRAIRAAIDFRRDLKSVGYFPGYRLLIGPIAVLGNISPIAIPGVTLAYHHWWKSKYDDFRSFGWDIISAVSVWSPQVLFMVADPVALKEMLSSRTRFVKPVEVYNIIDIFGRNILVSEGDEWKKHRKISGPAFSEPNNKLVWDEAVKVTLELIEKEWQNGETVEVDHVNDITLNLALFIIGSAGFGKAITFSDDRVVPSGHQMSFKSALHIFSTNLIALCLVPKWAFGLTEFLRTLRLAKDEMKQYLHELVEERRTSEKKTERCDLFSSLLKANSEEAADGQNRLSDDELVANIFIFLLAGHETTAHTLCFVLGLLAMYPNEQEILYEHIMSILPGKRIPTYEDMNSLSHVQAVLYETLRLYPPAINIPKKAAEDTTLTAGNAKGERLVVPIPKGALVYVDVVGLHYNPRVWEDPSDFRPQRFNENWPRDGFLPFSGGARSCLGRRFSETESIAILSVLLARYKVEVKDEPQYASETFEQRKERIFAVNMGITISPIRMPLVFRRR